jgi:hypothetical protein
MDGPDQPIPDHNLTKTRQQTKPDTGQPPGGPDRSKGNPSPPTTTTGTGTGTNTKSNSENFQIPILKSNKKRKPEQKPNQKQEPDKNLEININLMLITGFDFISVRLGEHWRVSPEEATAISQPASNIMQRLGVNQTANKYMDYIMLLTGVSMVVVPRILIHQSLGGQKKNESTNTDKKSQIIEINNTNNGSNNNTISRATSIKADIISVY